MSYNILIVDDSTVMRGMIIKTLRLSGLPLNEIHEAATGAEGLKVISEHWIDLALVDINMPVMNGEEMIDHIRTNPETAGLPIIVVSTEGSETRLDALQQKGARIIHKPFQPEQLRALVREMTGVSDESAIGNSVMASSGPDF